MFTLPQILLLGDVIVEKTAFSLKKPDIVRNHTGNMRISGHVRGYISGMVDADLQGTVHGTINAMVESGNIEEEKMITEHTENTEQNKEEV